MRAVEEATRVIRAGNKLRSDARKRAANDAVAAAGKSEEAVEKGSDDIGTENSTVADSKNDHQESSTAAAQASDTAVEANKENSINEDEVSNSQDDETKQSQSSIFGGLGNLSKSIMSTMKGGVKGVKNAFGLGGSKKQEQYFSTTAAKEKVGQSGNMMAELDAMKESSVPKKIGRGSSRAKDDDDISTASSSSCDSIWDAGLTSSKNNGGDDIVEKKADGHDVKDDEGDEANEYEAMDIDTSFDDAFVAEDQEAGGQLNGGGDVSSAKGSEWKCEGNSS